MGTRVNTVFRVACAAGVLTLLLYLRALLCGFCPSDDHVYILDNSFIRTLDWNFLVSAFAGTYAGWWMPLTWLSFALDYHFWQLNPVGYHLTNVLLHAVNTGLVVLLADRLIKSSSALAEQLQTRRYLYPATLLLAGLLFGIHPLRVEAVAWITARKDLLSGLFSLGALLLYLRFARREPAAQPAAARRDYLLALLCFLLALMAKPVSVVLPLMFLVLDWCPLGRIFAGNFRRALLEKIPFLLLAAAVSAATLISAGQNNLLKSAATLTLWQRLLVSGNALFDYCRLLLVPVGINPLQLLEFPLPPVYALKSAVVAGVLVLLFFLRKRSALTVTWLCFLLPLLPVLGFFQNGDQALAARYTYLPSLAPSIAAAVTLAIFYCRVVAAQRSIAAHAVTALLAACLLFYAGMSYLQIRVWDGTESYWSRVIEMQPLAKPYFQRGEYYAKAGRLLEAVSDYSMAIDRADGDYRRYVYNIYAFRGEALRLLGRNEEAVTDFTTAIALSPHRIYYYSRGEAFRSLGRTSEAKADLRIAGEVTGGVDYWFMDISAEEIKARLEQSPDDSEALAARGTAALRRRDYQAALADLDRAISLAPANALLYWERSSLHLEAGMADRAMEDCATALRLNPRFVDPYLRRASIHAGNGAYEKALEDLDTVIKLDRSRFEGHANRGLLLYRLGRPAEAVQAFDAALAIQPGSADMRHNREIALRSLNGAR